MEIPENYRGISFASWLDIFLEYALCLVKAGRHLESYEICEAAKDAIVFYHSREDMFLIHICWCSRSFHIISDVLRNFSLLVSLRTSCQRRTNLRLHLPIFH